MTIYLDLDGKETATEIISESTFRSKHTGRELKCIEVRLVEKEKTAHEKLLKILQSGKEEGIDSTDGKGKVLSKWKVKNNSYSYSEGSYDSNYYHSIELEEMEKLEVTCLKVGGLELLPYSYKEKFDEDALIIEARVVLSESQYSDFKEVMKKTRYFPVIRQGITEELREMRFGETRWSKHEHGIKHELLLVDKSYDDIKKGAKGFFDPEMSRMQDMIAEDTEIIDELLSTLKNKGLLSLEEVDSIRVKVSERVWDRKREFYRMKDIDDT
jgi:hypothetical protein